MSVFRILLLILFIGSYHVNFATAATLNKNVSTTVVASLDSGISTKFCAIADTVSFSLETNFPSNISNPSDIGYDDFKTKFQFLCQHKNRIALLYISGNVVSLKFDSYNISSPFHFFP